jgi:hypothetical protein
MPKRLKKKMDIIEEKEDKGRKETSIKLCPTARFVS